MKRNGSIGKKLILIISAMLVVSLILMIFLVTYFFRGDKIRGIDDDNRRYVEIISLNIESQLTKVLDKANIIVSTVFDGSSSNEDQQILIDRFFEKEQDIVGLSIIEMNNQGLFRLQKILINQKLAQTVNLSEEDFKNNLIKEKEFFKKALSSDLIIHNSTMYFKSPMIGIGIPLNKKGTKLQILALYITMDKFLDLVKSSDIRQAYIINGEGELLAHPDSSLLAGKINLSNDPIVKMMLTSPVDTAVKAYTDEQNEKYFGAYSKIGMGNCGVIVKVKQDLALKAVERMIITNILITIIVIAIAILIVYFFAKTITSPIIRLKDAAEVIESGKFDVDLATSSNDEIGLLTESFAHMAEGLQERERMKDAFGKFVNKEVAERALHGELKLGGESKEGVVFFSDIRSFTEISENLAPEEVVEFLNEYMTAMVECVKQTDGVVDKFIGDAIMALWGIPVSQGNDTERAINCALLMRKTLLKLNETKGTLNKPKIRIGCAINTGEVLAGQIGSSERMEYTVIGDTVNLASRLEALNKPFGTDILISSDSYQKVKGIYYVAKMKKISVKGKKELQQIYAVLGRKDDPNCPKSFKELREILEIDISLLPKFDPKNEEKKYEIVS